MQTSNNSKALPLWKKLNEERTASPWIVASTEPGDEYATNVLANINFEGDKRLVMQANYSQYFSEQAEANAQYTVLAVNNLHILAEALEEIKTLATQATWTDNEAEREGILNDIAAKAKELLTPIS